MAKSHTSLQRFCKIFSEKKRILDKKFSQTVECSAAKCMEWDSVESESEPMLHFAIDEYNGLFVMDQFQPVSLLHTNNKAHTHTPIIEIFSCRSIGRAFPFGFSFSKATTNDEDYVEKKSRGCEWYNMLHLTVLCCVVPMYNVYVFIGKQFIY